MADDATGQGAPTYEIEQRDAIKVYAGDKGHVVISQEDFAREEHFVLVHPDDVERLIEHLRAAREDAIQIRTE